MTRTRSSLQERGSTIVFALLLLSAVVALTIAALSGASNGLKISQNYRTGLQALLAAEAGAVHAQEAISDWGVIRFDTDILPSWEVIHGGSPREMPGDSTIRYRSTVAADPWNPVAYLMLTTVGHAPNESNRTVLSRLKRDQVYSPGAIYLPSDAVDPKFNGSAFLVDGHDTRLDGTPNPSQEVPGITTRSDDAKREVLDEISEGQTDNIIGAGGEPSVESSAGPTTDRIRTEIVPGILSQPGVVVDPGITGNDTFGTLSNPQITHFTSSVTINGTMDGVGILIVDQGLKINGNVSFTGLIIVRGTTEITTVSGNATTLGAIWTTDLKLTVAGSASVTYSSEALALASEVGGGNLLPRRVRAVAWKEL